MRVCIKSHLEKRIQCASKNGSKVAEVVLEELRKNKETGEDVLTGNSNYFDSVRVKNDDIEDVFISCFSKDINNENFPETGNPDAVWKINYRSKIAPNTFATSFVRIERMKRDGELTSDDLTFFDSAMNVCSNVTVDVRDRYEDFIEAYLSANYIQKHEKEAPLHKSCMRSENNALSAADFYSNFCQAKILVASDEEGNILGRALLWEDVYFCYIGEIGTLLDRVYFSHDFVRTMIINKAIEIGVNFRKTKNTFSAKKEFTVINTSFGIPVGCEFESIASRRFSVRSRFSGGAPYLDTFSYIASNNGDVCLTNINDDNCLAILCETTGNASIVRNVCPICGKKLGNNELICPECIKKYSKLTVFGYCPVCEFKEYNGMYYPKICFDVDGTPKENLVISNVLSKL